MVNALVLGVVEKFLSYAQLVQLSLTEVIALSPDAQAQFIHRDELLFDAYPFDYSYEVNCNTLRDDDRLHRRNRRHAHRAGEP